MACCPANSACTGTVGAPDGAAQTAGPATGSSGAASAGITHAISGSNTVSNQYYQFPVIPTTFADAADCSTSFSSCQAESAKCTGLVEGGGYDVTISGQNGQITQQAALAPASAEAICSSLSQEACHGLQLSQCSSLGGATATAAGGSFVVGSSNAAPTRCIALYGLGVGMAVGFAGQIAG